eukprot:253667_1
MSETNYIPLHCDDGVEDEHLTELFKSTETNLHFGHPTKHGVVVEPPLTHLQLWRFSLINMYVTDALNTRPPNQILEGRCPKPGLCGITIHTAYKMSHNSFWSLLVYGSIWIHLCLIVYEPWANFDMKPESYPIHLYIIECFILAIYSIDVYLHYISHDTDNYWDLSWAKVIVLCIVLNYIDIFTAIIFNTFLINGFLLRVGAVLRPMFLITRSQFLRATCRSILKSVPNVLDVLLLVCLYILMFAVLGYVLFSEQQLGIGVHISSPNTVCDEEAVAGMKYDTDCQLIQDHGNVNFNTLFDSYLSLCVLMSTANFPDVMMPSFHDNKASAFFFAAFISFGIYYLMSIIFAVIYHHYHTDNAHFVRKMTNNRARSLDAAFKQMVIFSKELQLPSYQLDEEKVEKIDFNTQRIYFSLFRRFLQFRRKGFGDRKTRILYNAMCQARVKTEAVKLHEDEGIGISRDQWQNLYKFVNVEIFRDPSFAVEFFIRQGKENVMLSLILGDENMYSMDGGCCEKLFINKNVENFKVVGDRNNECCFLCTQKIYFIWLRFRGWLYRIFTHKWVSKIIDLMVWIGTLTLIYEIQLKNYNKTLDEISNACIYIFTVEVTLRFIAFGKYFLKDGFNILDFIVVYASLFIDVFNPFQHGYFSNEEHQRSHSNGIVAFRLLRFIRALGTIDRFKLIISTSVTVLKKVGVLFSLEFCIFYIFSVIGVFCYGGMVSKESSLEMLYAAIQRNDVDDISFWEYIRDNYYYDNNMNYITNTIMVMVELTVVNQWHAVMRMYVELSTKWTYLYFYSFYFISVLIVTNVLTAFIFDAFIIQLQAARIEQKELNRKHAREAAVLEQQQLEKDKVREKQTRKNQKKIFSLQNLMSSRVSRSGSELIKNQSQTQKRNSLFGIEFNELPDKTHPANFSTFSMDSNTSDSSKTEDYLDDYIQELNDSDKDDWHKWLAIAMLYEFDSDDVIRGVWLYDRKKTTADFYEQIYGEVFVDFDEYLRAWGEPVPVPIYEHKHENNDSKDSMDGAEFVGMDSNISRDDTFQSFGDSQMTYQSKQHSIRGSGKDIIITRKAIKAKSILNDKDLTSTVNSLKDREGNINKVLIQGPKQSSIFSALSTAPQVGFAPQIINRKQKKQMSKASKLLDVYIPETPI